MRRPKPGTKTRRLAQERLERHLTRMGGEDLEISRLETLVPDAWAMLEADADVREKKTKVTLYLDASVAAFFRAMGEGYQGRINRLLAVYAQAMIAESRWADEAYDREVARLLGEVAEATDGG